MWFVKKKGSFSLNSKCSKLIVFWEKVSLYFQSEATTFPSLCYIYIYKNA